MSIVNRIKWTPLKDDQYYREEVQKKTIYLHHTAGSSSPAGAIKWWNETPERVATAFVIGGKPTRPSDDWKDGDLYQAFSSKYWAYHLGLKQEHLPPGSESSKLLNAQAIGIEICSWGWLTQKDGKYTSWANAVVPAQDVISLDYRGQRYWEAYTDAQLETLRELLLYLGDKFEIPLCYKGDAMFDLDMRAFRGEPGVWTHTSVRKDKTDCYPDPRLIKMLKEIGGTAQ